MSPDGIDEFVWGHIFEDRVEPSKVVHKASYSESVSLQIKGPHTACTVVEKPGGWGL